MHLEGECDSPGSFSLSDGRTPRKAQKDIGVRRGRVGYLPELLAIETTAESLRQQHEEKRPAHIFLTKPKIDLRAIEFELNSNAKMADYQPLRTSKTKHKPPTISQSHLKETKPSQDSVIADLVALITDLDSRRRRDLAAEKQRRAEEQARRHAAEQLADEKRAEEGKREANAEEKQNLAELSIPSDVQRSLIATKAVIKISESSEYKRFLRDPHPSLKAYRVAIGKAAGAVPNKLGNTMQRLAQVYQELDKHRHQITSAEADAALKGTGFDLTAFQTLTRNVAELCPEVLGSLQGMTLLAFHFYFRLSSVLLDNAQQQMTRNAATMWTYSHFLALLWRQWADDFKLIFLSVLHSRSNWAIPWPSQDTKIREEATNDELADWCHKTAGYFSLKLAMFVCTQDAPQCWQLLTRFLNRLSEKYFTHPAISFLLADSLKAVNHFLCSKYKLQMINVHNLLRTTIAPKLLEISRLPESWKEIRVPTTHLHLLLTDMASDKPVTHPPDGYVLSAREEELNADV